MNKTVLLVDDELHIRRDLGDHLMSMCSASNGIGLFLRKT